MRQRIQSFKDLGVWQKAVELAVDLYALTRRFPPQERYAMTSQIQRAAVSIPSNIAEGWGKSGSGYYLNAISHARGSLRELETLLLIAHRVGYIKRETFRALAERTDELARMLFSLSRSVANSQATGRPDHPPQTSDLGPETYRAG
jgi:four helix bundle protein